MQPGIVVNDTFGIFPSVSARLSLLLRNMTLFSEGGDVNDKGEIDLEDQRIGKVLVNEFRQFKDVRTVVWNEQTGRTAKKALPEILADFRHVVTFRQQFVFISCFIAAVPVVGKFDSVTAVNHVSSICGRSNFHQNLLQSLTQFEQGSKRSTRPGPAKVCQSHPMPVNWT